MLHDLLRENRERYASSYQGGLTNHLSMCLTALHRLGAPDERLAAFASTYAQRLEPAAAAVAAAAAAAVDAAAIDDDVDNVAPVGDAELRHRLTSLLPGLAGAAFHGVIRVAYATMAKDTRELAVALSYAEETALRIDVPKGGKETEVAVLAERLRVIEKPKGSSITERLRIIAADPRFSAVAADLAVDKSTLSQVSSLGARWYLAADDFASLHVLTGAHAVRTLRPFTTDVAAADRALAVAALACFVVCGCPQRVDARGLAYAEDAEIKARAIACDDDHVQKLALSCFDEEPVEGDRIYRILATRAARRGRA